MAKKREIVGSMSEWSGALKDLFRQINDGSLKLEQLKAFVGHQNLFISSDSLLKDWARFYKEYFNIDADLSDLKIPEKNPGFDRLIIVAKGLTLDQIYNVCAKHFPCWRYTDDLDKAVTHNDRTAEKTYAVSFRNRKEADKELKNLSANQLEKRNIPGITLLERLIHELKYWDETKQHLDETNITLCSGSRYSDGGVPSVDWYNGRMQIHWCGPQDADSRLRARAVVSLTA